MRPVRFTSAVAILLAAGTIATEEIPNSEFMLWSKLKKTRPANVAVVVGLDLVWS